ncbi:MAG: hypothetical protein L6R36_006188 [Xanthoria steineri]|nr:MAG: hypothetical protein L6R36_006188 [Xanthoria steineri]
MTLKIHTPNQLLILLKMAYLFPLRRHMSKNFRRGPPTMERQHQPRQQIPIRIQGFRRSGRLPQSQSQDDGLGGTTEARTESRLHLLRRQMKHETGNGASDEAETAFPTTLTTCHPTGTDSPPTSSNRSPPVILPLQDANAVPQAAATASARRYDLDLEAKQA